MMPSQDRICSQCQGRMAPADTERPGSPFIWSDRTMACLCRDCGHRAVITQPSSLIFGFLSGIAGLAVLIWGLLSLGSLKTLLGSGALGIAMGLGAALLVVVLALGGAVSAWSAFKGLRMNLSCPPAAPGQAWGRLAATLLVSALPVALAVGFGFFDHYVIDLDDVAVLVLPVVFSPLLLGVKLGLSFMGLFLGCAMWMGILVGVIFLF